MISYYKTKNWTYAIQLFEAGRILKVKRKSSYYECCGYTNDTIDNKLIMFLDCDAKKNVNERDKYIAKLQKYYGLSDFYEFKTAKGFHYICLDKLSKEGYVMVAFTAVRLGLNDEKFFLVGKDSKRKWTLRLSDKGSNRVVYNRTIKSKFNNYEKSLAHFMVLQAMAKGSGKVLNIPERLDTSKELTFVKYPSGLEEKENG